MLQEKLLAAQFGSSRTSSYFYFLHLFLPFLNPKLLKSVVWIIDDDDDSSGGGVVVAGAGGGGGVGGGYQKDNEPELCLYIFVCMNVLRERQKKQ
ncbi:hypothetical protein DERF_007194 [Dermatophagoides farinae]|uniref:Uncharacterized protein n=1 Tax=Dermatophagoides farinae TaxID=6954 RepID=A0A922I0U4_DERFA|nr:hypothetical protein DERF_007194 [Dermatophagoides farinae]